MATVVVGTGSVHASAALCDHLQDQVGERDTVHAAAWATGAGDEAERDAADALNGVRSRLGVRASVETHRLGAGEEDDPVAGLLTLADRTGADELVVGSGGDGGLDPDGVARLRADATRPVAAVSLD